MWGGSKNVVISSWLRPAAKLYPVSILDIYKVFEHIDMLSMEIQYSSLTQLYIHYLAQIVGFWVTCGVKMMSFHHECLNGYLGLT